MPNLTAQQASDLSRCFLLLAQAIGDYRFEYWNDLDPQDREYLGETQRRILTAGEDMLAESTYLLMEDVDQALQDLGAITDDIHQTIKHLQNVQKVINVAGSILTLGGAIIAKDPQAISSSLQDLLSTWNA